MSTIFTNQTPWITLADAFVVFCSPKNHDFFCEENVDKLLSLVPTGEPLFRAEIMSASDHKLHTLDLISRRTWCIFYKNTKILDSSLRRTLCTFKEKGVVPVRGISEENIGCDAKKTQKQIPQKCSCCSETAYAVPPAAKTRSA